MQKQEVENQSRWKSRYYEALGEIEEREKTWREAERLLRHLITRLTLAADNWHHDLSRNLTELREAVRDGRDILQLRELIEQIGVQVAELDNLRGHRTDAGHPANVLLELLDKLALQDANGSQISELKTEIRQLGANDDASPVYEHFVNLLNGSLLAADESARVMSRKQKILDRILLRQEKSGEIADETQDNRDDQQNTKSEQKIRVLPQKLLAPAVGDLLLQLALRMPDAVKSRINFHALKKHTNRARQRKDLIAIVDVIAQHIEAAYTDDQPTRIMLDDDSVAALTKAVKQIITQMNPPEDLRQRISELEKVYNEGSNDVDGLINCLNSLAEVVAEICSRLEFQRSELEIYFVQLGMQLEDIDAGMQRTASFFNESQNDNLQMDKAVRGELHEIRQSMQKASDLVQLTCDIQLRLDSIDRYLLQFHDAEKARYEQAQKMVGELCEKVTALESDNRQLQDRLGETRKRGMRDVLTGIPGRQVYEERLATEVARCKRYGTSLSMVVWDIDNITSINDNYGYASGNRVLKTVAEILSTHVRETDFVARYGGEEFVSLMPQTTADAARQVADKLRKKIEDTPFYFHDTNIAVTISAGVAQFQQGEMVTSLFDRAEAAMSDAKQAGRNQVKTAETSP